MPQPTYIEQVYRSIPYTSDLAILQAAGVQPTKLGGMFQLFSAVVDTIFRNRIDHSIFTGVQTSISDYRMRFDRNKPSLINIFDERHFADFCGLATRMRLGQPSDVDYEETLNIECIFTDDQEFDIAQIPAVSTEQEYQAVLSGGTPLKSDHIYFLRTDNIAKNDGRTDKYFEYLIYAPSSSILSYN